MHSFSFHWLVPVALTMAMPMAFAQPSTESATPDSKSAAPSSVTLSYRSAFADYRAYSEQPVASWREANDKVDQIGGWRAYAREASQPEPVPAPASGATGAKP